MEPELNMGEKQSSVNMTTIFTPEWSLSNASPSIMRLEPLNLERGALRNIKKLRNIKRKTGNSTQW